MVKFTNNNGTLSGFTAEIEPGDLAYLISQGITIVEGVNVELADPILKSFRFQYQVFNGTAYRYIIDAYYK